MNLLILPHRAPLALPPPTFTDAQDREEFYTSIDEEERTKVKELHDAMLRIEAAPNPNQGCKALARLHPRRAGWSAVHLRTLFDGWQAEGRDWRWLVDRRRFPNARQPMLSPEAQEFVRAELLKNQRKFAPAIRAIQARWRSWWRTGSDKYAIPGFVDATGAPLCPAPDAGYLPRALQEHNLRRVKIAPAVVELVRYGTAAAMAVLGKIPGTREGLRWLEWVTGDDFEPDVAMYAPGHGRCLPLQFGFWERSCSFYLPDCFIQRPRLAKDDGRWDKLKRRDFLFAVALLLERYGWPLDWKMHIHCERGTATMNRAQAQWLHEISGGQIIVGWSTMEGEFVAAWEERRSGNTTAKPGQEGFHGILKNEMGHLRGNRGKDREHAIALDYGRERLTMQLDNAAVQLPSGEREKIIAPYLTAPQLYRETFDAIARIHEKPDHACEGFEMVIEWRPRGLQVEPLPLAAMEGWLRENPRVTEATLNEHVEWYDRPETRAERQARLSRQGRFLAPPPGAMVPFYEDNIVYRAIGADYALEFSQDNRKLRFIAPSVDERLEPGDKVCGFYRPDEQVIHLFTGGEKNRRFLVTYRREGKLRVDADAATKQGFFRRKRAELNHAYGQADKATEEQVREAQAEAEHNAMVLAANGVLTSGNGGNVQRGCTPMAAAVQEVTLRRTAEARSAKSEARREAKAREIGRDVLRSDDLSTTPTPTPPLTT